MSSSSSVAPRSPWAAFVVVVGVAILTILDVAKVNVVITPIQESLGTSTTQTQLIVAGYVLAFGIVLVPAGRLGDQWNRKAMFLIGLTLFTLSSLTAALAPTAEILVTARILQGVAAGIQMPQVLGVIQNLFQGQQRGKAFGIFGASIGLGTAFGPTVGGLLVGAFGNDLGWRWTFGMNVPLALIVIPLAIWLLPSNRDTLPAGEAEETQLARDLDVVGVGLMSATVLFVMLPLVLTTGSGDSATRWLWLIPGAITAAIFVWWENRYVAAGRSPVLDFRLFSFRSYRNGVVITSLWFAAMPAMFLVMTLYNQQALGHEAVVVGMITIPYAIVSAIVAGIIGKHTFKYATQLVIWGLAIYGVALLGILAVAYFVPAENVPMAMAIALGVAGVGPGFVMAANQMRTLKDVPLHQAGVAGSFQQVGQRVGNALGTAVATAVFYSLTVGLTRAEAGEVVEPDRQFLFGFEVTVMVLVGFIVLALVFAVIDHRGHVQAAKQLS